MFDLLYAKKSNICEKKLQHQEKMIESEVKNKINQKNQTPLHYEARNHSKEGAEILIRKGADINAKDIIYQIIL